MTAVYELKKLSNKCQGILFNIGIGLLFLNINQTYIYHSKLYSKCKVDFFVCLLWTL